MSFDVYLQFFVAGRESGSTPEAIRAAFPVATEVLDDDYWQLHFGVESTDLFLRPAASGDGGIHSLSFHRPARDARLWQGVFALLDREGAVCHCAGGAAAWVRDARSAMQLPADLRAAMASIAVVSDAVGLQAAFATAMAQAGED